KKGAVTFTRYTSTDGLPDNWIQSIFEDNWGTLWVGTYNSLAKKKGDSFEVVDLYNSAPQNWAYTINQDRKNTMWFGSIGNGLIYNNGSSMRTLPESLNDYRISTIASYKDKTGALWFGTYEGGLWKYTPR
ncbi:MAG: two-component regulator propeller domain-containing protein, partial [Bacteroidota bacterium]